MHTAKLRSTVMDSEQQRAAECRDQVTEMSAAELALTMLTQTEDAAVLSQNACLKRCAAGVSLCSARRPPSATFNCCGKTWPRASKSSTRRSRKVVHPPCAGRRSLLACLQAARSTDR
jgi:hypothetical protein